MFTRAIPPLSPFVSAFIGPFVVIYLFFIFSVFFISNPVPLIKKPLFFEFVKIDIDELDIVFEVVYLGLEPAKK